MQRRDQAIDPGPTTDLSEMEFSSIVAAGSGRYVGVLKEIPDKIESVVPFCSPRTRTTLGIPISHLTVQAVREHLAESDAAFAGPQNDNARGRHRSRVQIPRLFLLPRPLVGIVWYGDAQTDRTAEDLSR